MNDTIVTVVGNVVDSPRRYRPEGGSPVTNFRLASTARRFDSRSQEFVDSGTFWVDVECWNDLSGNVSGSVSKGDPVIVHGTLTTHSWESENGRRSTPRIRAAAVGPNLARGTAAFLRTRPARAADVGNGPAEEAMAALPRPAADGFAAESDIPVPGRDYVDATAALHGVDATDLTPEPAHA
ncbi:single-stranded DNA-binding protein [Geodermatophilus sabuli]|uniref:Single-strand DNA-binding protein n=1 Tax=Geodermatophilus sabuli TaxID=1564158 RepID=A0A285E611_9ACTN|nr:single-stranded DNA-binding protein [Geodermatophilus sabuli]MBB3082687.1 single-strand DNA-binding protein [Geodermatophilus sabuli]SNX94447.1 single-strand DNA-binding protein [Geodermatophilus sabuli]